MYIMVVNHDVEDYERWKAGFDQYPPSRGGARFWHVNRRVDDPDNVTIICGWDTLDAAVAFRDKPELRDAMGSAGVIGEPRFEISEEVDSASS
jgi:heme-degrading monooxygenase HmoA